MKARGIFLRGGFKFGYPIMHLRLWTPFVHAGILLENGIAIEASALRNKVVSHTYKKPIYCWDKILTFRHLPDKLQEQIADQAKATIGIHYDWVAGVGQALGNPMDDPRKINCYEQAGTSCKGILDFQGKELYAITPWDLWRAWRKNKKQWQKKL
jgi:hypothetical protein